jgi:RNA recognition motif-containing protein
MNAMLQLPWSTSNEDLVELFETTGTVVLAEILFDTATQRSKGSGIVQFKDVSEAEEACAKFTGYLYGNRPLGKHVPNRSDFDVF